MDFNSLKRIEIRIWKHGNMHGKNGTSKYAQYAALFPELILICTYNWINQAIYIY